MTPEDTGETVIAIGELHGSAGGAEELRALLLQHEQLAAAQPGCRMFHIGIGLDDRDRYLITQEWESIAAVGEYLRSAPFYDLQRRLVGLLTSDWKLRLYRAGDVLDVD